MSDFGSVLIESVVSDSFGSTHEDQPKPKERSHAVHNRIFRGDYWARERLQYRGSRCVDSPWALVLWRSRQEVRLGHNPDFLSVDAMMRDA